MPVTLRGSEIIDNRWSLAQNRWGRWGSTLVHSSSSDWGANSGAIPDCIDHRYNIYISDPIVSIITCLLCLVYSVPHVPRSVLPRRCASQGISYVAHEFFVSRSGLLHRPIILSLDMHKRRMTYQDAGQTRKKHGFRIYVHERLLGCIHPGPWSWLVSPL